MLDLEWKKSVRHTAQLRYEVENLNLRRARGVEEVTHRPNAFLAHLELARLFGKLQ
jgi:hypothetical protein